MPKARDGLIETLNLLASAHVSAGRYREALTAVEEALTLLSDSPSYWRAATLSNLASIHRFQDQLPLAITAGEDALGVCNQLDPTQEGTRQLRATLLANLGGLYRVNREYTRALPLLKEAWAVSRSIQNESPANGVDIQFSLGLIYMGLADYDSAGPYLEAAMERHRAAHQTKDTHYGVKLDAMATWNKAKGRLAEAARLYQEAAQITKEAFGELHPNYGTSLASLAKVYAELGWHDKAEAASRQAAGILERTLTENHVAYLQCIQNLGVSLTELGRYAEAEKMTLGALRIIQQKWGRASSEYAVCLHNLVMLLPMLSSSGLIELLIDFMEDSQAPTIDDTTNEFFERLGDPDGLRLLFLEKVAEVERAAGLGDHTSHATTLLNLGHWHHDRGGFAKAEEYFKEAVRIERSQANRQRPQLADCLAALGTVCFSCGRSEEALTLLQEAHVIGNRFLGEAFTTGSEIQRRQYLDMVRRRHHVLLSLVLRKLPETAEAVRIAFDVTLQRKGIAFEALAVQRDALLCGKYPELVQQLTQLRDLQLQIGRQERNGTEPERIAHLYMGKEELEKELAQKIPEMNLEQELASATCVSVSAALPVASMLVEIVLVNEFDASAAVWKELRYLAFILSPTGQTSPVLVDLGAAADINRLITEFQNDSLRLDDDAEVSEAPSLDQSQAGIALRKLIFDPIIERSGGATKIFLAADGTLSRLPFGALPAADGRFLIDEFEFSYLTSGRDLLRFRASNHRECGPPAVVADPDFDFFSGDPVSSAECPDHHGYFERLPGTAIEGEQVARLLKVAAVTGRDALDGVVKSLRSPLVLHIATHGFFERGESKAPVSEGSMATPSNPLLWSGLALAGANCCAACRPTLPAEAEDGILTAQDITGMDLWGTEMVVLSACETGIGEIKIEDGVYGLQRAAMQAGASTLIMSLWRIPDEETQELMGEFYRRLKRGEGRSAALRQAQLMLRSQEKAPALWASFVCYGDPNPFSLSVG
ncbi:MAG TPA: CHAT domain-containing protein [Bryobacteraceae bacterium]|nr:CHAT domain-containing protein [Bryobacteraceae bacterium]